VAFSVAELEPTFDGGLVTTAGATGAPAVVKLPSAPWVVPPLFEATRR
jgi:hypothetical protein